MSTTALRYDLRYVIKDVMMIKDDHDSNLRCHWRIQGGAPGTRAPPGGPNSFIFMQFSAQMWKIIAILGVGAPPWGKSWIRQWWRYEKHVMILFYEDTLRKNVMRHYNMLVVKRRYVI